MFHGVPIGLYPTSRVNEPTLEYVAVRYAQALTPSHRLLRGNSNLAGSAEQERAARAQVALSAFLRYDLLTVFAAEP